MVSNWKWGTGQWNQWWILLTSIVMLNSNSTIHDHATHFWWCVKAKGSRACQLVHVLRTCVVFVVNKSAMPIFAADVSKRGWSATKEFVMGSERLPHAQRSQPVLYWSRQSTRGRVQTPATPAVSGPARVYANHLQLRGVWWLDEIGEVVRGQL
jgi:hypothetical protein